MALLKEAALGELYAPWRTSAPSHVLAEQPGYSEQYINDNTSFHLIITKHFY